MCETWTFVLLQLSHILDFIAKKYKNVNPYGWLIQNRWFNISKAYVPPIFMHTMFKNTVNHNFVLLVQNSDGVPYVSVRTLLMYTIGQYRGLV